MPNSPTDQIKLVPKVTMLPVVTSLDVDAERILNAALEQKLQTAIVVGVDADGGFYFASSVADGGTALWWLEKAKLALLTVDQRGQE